MDVTYPSPTGLPSGLGEPTWEVTQFFPHQGKWGEDSFLKLPAPHRFELSQGRLELLPMPTWTHQLLIFFLVKALHHYLEKNDVGRAACAPLYVRLWEDEIRQPDVVFCFHNRITDYNATQTGADLVMEVISPGKENRERDEVKKRALYAKAGIAEYWIVDPELHSVEVLGFNGSSYEALGNRSIGTIAHSKLLPGFAISVTELFAEARRK